MSKIVLGITFFGISMISCSAEVYYNQKNNGVKMSIYKDVNVQALLKNVYSTGSNSENSGTTIKYSTNKKYK